MLIQSQNNLNIVAIIGPYYLVHKNKFEMAASIGPNAFFNYNKKLKMAAISRTYRFYPKQQIQNNHHLNTF